jgi:hypothetical protein
MFFSFNKKAILLITLLSKNFDRGYPTELYKQGAKWYQLLNLEMTLYSDPTEGLRTVF